MKNPGVARVFFRHCLFLALAGFLTLLLQKSYLLQSDEGYTLNAALVAAGLLYLLKWGQSRERRHLYTAIGIFALSSGNHLIVIALDAVRLSRKVARTAGPNQ